MTKRLMLSVLLLLGMLGSVAWADTSVSYYTTHTLGSPSTNGAIIGLSFDDYTKSNLVIHDGSFAFSKLGTFVIDENRSLWDWIFNTPVGTDTFNNVPFTLTVHQTNPSGGTGTFDADINGSIYHDGSTAYVSFDTPSVRIGDVLYTLTASTYSLNANDGWDDPGTTTIQAKVTVVPEPGSLALLGSGLLGLGGYLRRRLF